MPKRVHRRRNRAADYLVYCCLRTITAIARSLHPDTSYKAARFLGDIFYALSSRHRHRSIEHLRRSFPDWPESKCRYVARRSMHNMMYLGVEFMFTPRLVTIDRWRKHVKLVGMEDALELLLKKEKGLIFLTGHYGNWEIVGYTMAVLGFPITAIARKLDNPYLNRYIMEIREKRGLSILDKKGAADRIPQILCEKESVGFIADQDAGKKGLFVDFFGRKASTYKSIALLAIIHEVPIIVGYGTRLGDGFNFEIGVERYIYPDEWKNKKDPRMYITCEYTKAMENLVRKTPSQYLWVHRRWKHRPDGSKAQPDGIA